MKTKIPLLYSLLIAGLAACSVQEKETPPEKLRPDFGDEDLELVHMLEDGEGDSLEVELMHENYFTSMPDTPQGYRIQAMLDALKSEDDEQLLPFVQEHYDPDFLVQVPENDHKDLLRQLREQLKQAEIETVSSLTDEYRIELLKAGSNEKRVLDIYFQPTAPYKISGVRIL